MRVLRRVEYMLHPVPVGLARVQRFIEQLDIAGQSEPFQVHGHAAKIFPVVHQRQNQFQSQIVRRFELRRPALESIWAIVYFYDAVFEILERHAASRRLRVQESPSANRISAHLFCGTHYRETARSAQ